MQGRLNDWLVSVMGLVPRLYWIIWFGCGTVLFLFFFYGKAKYLLCYFTYIHLLSLH